MLLFGTCIYSWLISSISTYVKKNNEKFIKYEEKVQILEEIKLNNPNFSDKLYDKILKLLYYRKFHEDEAEKNVLFDSLPNSLKNTLVIEMYKSYIDGFSFFKGIENREFIVQVISKLNPVLGVKGDILVQEGEFFEDVIFIKSGYLSLEIWIDKTDSEEIIENYLNKNGFINNSRKKELKKIDFKSNKSLIYEENYNFTNTINNQINNYYYKKENSNIRQNKKKLKVLDIRRNEHFGDVFMFLNQKSPYYIKVGSKKADLLLLKKLDALNISSNYPNIWKIIIKKPLANSKTITNLAFKVLVEYYNFNGIKTKVFKNRFDKYCPKYYLKPILNPIKIKSLKKRKKGKDGLILDGNNRKLKNSMKKYIKKASTKKNANKFNDFEDNYSRNDSKNKDSKISEKERESNIFPKKSWQSKKSFHNDSYNQQNILNREYSFNKEKNLNISNNNIHNDIFFIKNNNNKINNSISEEDDKINSCFNKNKIKKIKHQNPYGYQIIINNSEKKESNKDIKKNSENNMTNNFNYDKEINDEIYPGEDFNLKIYRIEKPKIMENNSNIILNNLNINKPEKAESVFINHFNIIGQNYITSNFEEINILKEKIRKLEFELELNKKKKFNQLEITYSESAFEIDSSYENINLISENKYILKAELRDLTKQFIQNKIKILNKAVNSSFRSDIDSSYKSNNKFLSIKKMKEKKSRNFSTIISKKSTYKSDNKKKDISSNINTTKNVQKLFQDIVQNSSKQKIQTDNFISKIKDISLNNLKKVKRPSVDVYSNKSGKILLDKNKSIINIDEEDKKIKKKHDTCLKKIPNKNLVKKKKRNSALDIINMNIMKSSENLNQPEVFYAGLFNQLIFKRSSQKNNKYLYKENDENNDDIKYRKKISDESSSNEVDN